MHRRGVRYYGPSCFQNWIVPKMTFPTLDYGYELSAFLDQTVSKYVVLKAVSF